MNTKIKGLITIRSTPVAIIEHDGIEYVSLKPFAEMAQLRWEAMKRIANRDQNVEMFGTVKLAIQPINDGSDSLADLERIYIKLDRLFLYFCRVGAGAMQSIKDGQRVDSSLNFYNDVGTAIDEYRLSEAQKSTPDDDVLKHLVNLSKMHKTPVLAGIFAKKLNDKYDLNIPAESRRTFGNKSAVC